MPKDSSETWIKLFVAVAIILIGLIGYIGDRVIVGQDKQLKEMSDMNGNQQAFREKISRNKDDIRDVNVKVSGIDERVYKLEGKE